MTARQVGAWAPWGIAAIYGMLLVIPGTRAFAYELQRESGPVELATFLLLAAASLLCYHAAIRVDARLPRLLTAAAGVVLFFVAGEEVAWGQHFLGEPLVESWADANRQGETTVHNLAPFQGKSELIYLVIALAGLISRRPAIAQRLEPVHVSKLLVPGLILVVLYALTEVATAFLPTPHIIQEGMRSLAEVIEMITGLLALTWAVSVQRRLRRAAA